MCVTNDYLCKKIPLRLLPTNKLFFGSLLPARENIKKIEEFRDRNRTNLEIMQGFKSCLHKMRYNSYPRSLILGILPEPDPEKERLFKTLAICRCFAEEADFAWAGGLPLGGGGAVNGQPLEKLGGMMKHVRKALDLTAQALADRYAVPQEAAILFRKRFIPGWMYLFMGNLMWKMQARKNGVLQKINDRPYEPA